MRAFVMVTEVFNRTYVRWQPFPLKNICYTTARDRKTWFKFQIYGQKSVLSRKKNLFKRVLKQTSLAKATFSCNIWFNEYLFLDWLRFPVIPFPTFEHSAIQYPGLFSTYSLKKTSLHIQNISYTLQTVLDELFFTEMSSCKKLIYFIISETL